MMYLDLDEINSILQMSPWWSKSRWSLARFCREDFLGDKTVDLKQSICQRIFSETGFTHTGPIRMLANMRYFGFNINPIVTYYCFDTDENLQFIVAEVTNTPWKERKDYVLRCDPESKKQRIKFNKEMHVSPFNPMNMYYAWRSNCPAKRLKLHIETWGAEDKVLDATLSLRRTEITRKSLSRTLWCYPWMTFKVAATIYWQALKLCAKRVPIHAHPDAQR